MDFTIPSGEHKGKSLADAPTEAITYWYKRKHANLEAEPNGRYAESDRKWLTAAYAEMERRKTNGGPAQTTQSATRPAPAQHAAPQGQAITVTQRPALALAGAYGDAAAVSSRLAEAAVSAHLVSPATTCAELPEGCAVALSVVQIDTASNEIYAITGNKRDPKPTDMCGLSKVALDKIAAAAGISWVPHLTGRLDDGRDPHYCHFRAVARVRDLDGTIRELPGEVEIDARDGSPQIEEIASKARARAAKYNDTNDGGASQILELRKFLIRHAESKAMNRAIRKLGVRTSYTRAELAKPFVVAKIMFTGRSEDPELRRMFAGKIADNFLASSNALYSGTPQAPHAAPTHALPSAAAAPQLHGAPRVGSVPADTDAYEAHGEDLPPPPGATTTPVPPAASPTHPDGGDMDRGPSPEAY